MICSTQYGPWALVTGAARGLGAGFARQLAEAGLNLILADRLESELQQTSRELQQAFSVEVLPVCVDLSTDDFMPELLARIGDCQVGLLVNNAGIASISPFLSQSIDSLVTQLHVNTRAVLQLTHHFANDMVNRGRGGIIILSSMAAEVAGAWNANYSGCKAYDLKLAESLWAELKPAGVDVLGFMPGATETEGYVAEGGSANDPMVMSVEDTVRDALNMLGKRPSAAAGRGNRAANFMMTRCLPRSTAINLVSTRIKKTFEVEL